LFWTVAIESDIEAESGDDVDLICSDTEGIFYIISVCSSILLVLRVNKSNIVHSI